MRFYRLSEQRVKSVLNSPKRTEEGVAPKTVAMMQPTSVKRIMDHGAGSMGRTTRNQETWNQEIWVMIQDRGGKRKIISAWRYPGRTKPRSEITQKLMKQAYNEYLKT